MLVNTAHLLLCILRNENDPTTKLLNNFEINYNDVKALFKQLSDGFEEDTNLPTSESRSDDGFDEPNKPNPFESQPSKGKTAQKSKHPFWIILDVI